MMNKKLIPAYLLTFVNVLGFSILMPVLPFIVKDYGAPKWVFGLLLTLYSTFQFIGAPVLGSLSDSAGRKPILLISQFGTLLSWVIFLIALSLPNFSAFGIAFPLIIIAFSRILDGITGGNASVTNAYVADITTRDEKAYVFGYLGGIAGIGMIIGPALGGLAASSPLGYSGTILVSITISVITLFTIYYWLKESHHEEHRAPRQKQSLWKIINIPGRVRDIDPSPVVKVLFIVKLFFSSMMGFYIGTMALFLIDLFKFDASEMGIFFLVAGTFLAFNQAFLSKRFVQKFGEYQTLIIGLSLCMVGMVAITLTINFYFFIGFYYILNLGLSLCFPTFNALISIHANPEKLGAVMGISESIGSFAMALFPVIGALMYTQLGFELYYIISGLPFIALILAVKAIRKLGTKAFE
jgi:MFS family permease